MMSFLLFYGAWYLGIGLVSAWLINQAIIYGNQTEPYTSSEIAFAIILWPINVGVFIIGFLISLFR
jgi:hypothetical protein